MDKSSPTRWMVFVALSVLLLAFIAYFERTAIYNEMNALKLIPTPERFTELYFANPIAIPTSTVAQRPLSFAFTINNLEGVTTTYPYTSYFMNPAGKRLTLASGTVTLPDEASTTITVRHTFAASNLTGTVVVALPSLNNQQIDFLLPYSN